MRMGVDTGGTFTDFVLTHQGRVLTHKVPSTPEDFARGVLAGARSLLSRTDRSALPFALIHASTVATNALLERKGARTGLITTRGFRDVLEIGRQTRPELYNLWVDRPPPLVPRRLRREVTERVAADGRVLVPLRVQEVERALDALVRQGVESVAVCLLFSFLRPHHERAIARMARQRGLAVSASCDVLPEFREYERTSTTVVNAYVSPVMQRYLRRLDVAARRLGAAALRVVQSNGGCLSARAAGARAVHTLLSGPAAGVMGALSVAQQALGSPAGKRGSGTRIITFDMGGTSTDVCLVAGEQRVSTEISVAGYPVRVPMMDIHTVGAGGGSLARVDAGGALHVGPQSAGARPGPACYGVGEEATVTDANLLLGRIHPEHFLGGRISLDTERARRALERLARRLGTDVGTAARAVIRIVNANMERAIRLISVERGHDPREFTLVSFGGAGGLHACALAAALRIPRVLIPRNPGVLSAWGAVVGDAVLDVSQTVMLPCVPASHAKLSRVWSRLQRQVQRGLQREGFTETDVVLERFLDLRYAGQSYELTVPYRGRLEAAAQAFHAAHARRYGHSAPREPLEIVTARIRAIGRLEKPVLEPIPRGQARARQAVVGKHGRLVLYDRARLRAGNVLQGPALVLEEHATTLLPEGWHGRVDPWGNLVLHP